MLPDEILKCKGGKLSEERITVLVAANMTGSKKNQLLVIGQSKRPCCLNNIKCLPIAYESNKKAMMTSNLFEQYLRIWNASLKQSNEKIILLVDNCSAHPDIKSLSQIKLVFLPANATSVLQPMDQGVIKCLKSNYRKSLVLKILQKSGETTMNEISVLDAILMVSKAWDMIASKIISNCFSYAGFQQLPTLHYDDDIPFTQWAQNLDLKLSHEDWTNFLNVDKNLRICQQSTDEEIVESVKMEIDEKPNKAEVLDEDQNIAIPSISEAMEAIFVLQKHIFFNNYDESTKLKLSEIEKSISSDFYLSKCQSKIDKSKKKK